MIFFAVPGRAQPAGSKRAVSIGGRARVIDANPKAAGWKERVALCARASYSGPLLNGPLSITVTVTLARPAGHYTSKGALRPAARPWPSVKPDLTKYLRGIEDACTGIVWRDDAQVVMVLAKKEYGDKDEILVAVEAL